MKMALKKLIILVLFIILQLSILVFSAPPPLEIDWTVARIPKIVDGCNRAWNVVAVYPTSFDKNGKELIPLPKDVAFPAPTLIVEPEQVVRVLIRNRLDEPTTIHWHGLLMEKTGYSDGVPTITQCPIQNNSNFLYEFKANKIPGTHWYHSHYKPQRVDGLYGYIIIKETIEQEGIDLNGNKCPYCVLVSDWYHLPAQELLDKYRCDAQIGAVTPEPVPHSVLLNGIGGGYCGTNNATKPANSCNDKDYDKKNITCVLSNEVYKFQRNKKYRLRILNSGALVLYYFSIDDHDLDVIEVEGMRVKSNKKIKLLPLHAGQRYSVIATTSNTKTDNFWMRLQTSKECIRPNTSAEEWGMLVEEIRAIVSYSITPGTPTTSPWILGKLNCTDLDYSLLSPDKLYLINYDTPLKPPSGPANKEFNFGIYMEIYDEKNKSYLTVGEIYDTAGNRKIYDDNIFGFTNNSIQYTIDNYNKYGSRIYNVYKYQNLNFYVLDKERDVIDVTLKSSDNISHPIHLHGHFFWVMEYTRGPGEPNEIYEKPIQRDTVTVPPKGIVKIRFQVDNPGVWACHCHIEWHVEVGMMAQFVELPAKVTKLSPLNNKIYVDKGKNTVNLTTWNELCVDIHHSMASCPTRNKTITKT
ncbi:multicopper oxidase [Gigaspora margarita]|uniref:Multicopper oxidase n=1 Tax=Gigaspora margarita TaxID=4874 RepID=A0A8H3XAN4_GIGMA|nr:multicopper oxidase [Gigaspora margarita]